MGVEGILKAPPFCERANFTSPRGTGALAECITSTGGDVFKDAFTCHSSWQLRAHVRTSDVENKRRAVASDGVQRLALEARAVQNVVYALEREMRERRVIARRRRPLAQPRAQSPPARTP